MSEIEEALREWVWEGWGPLVAEVLPGLLANPPHSTDVTMWRGTTMDTIGGEPQVGDLVQMGMPGDTAGFSWSDNEEMVEEHSLVFEDGIIFCTEGRVEGIDVYQYVDDNHELGWQREWLIPGPFRVTDVEWLETTEYLDAKVDWGPQRFPMVTVVQERGKSERKQGSSVPTYAEGFVLGKNLKVAADMDWVADTVFADAYDTGQGVLVSLINQDTSETVRIHVSRDALKDVLQNLSQV